MNASEASCFWRPRPPAIEERGLLLIAASGFSPIPTTSGASTAWIRLRSTSPWARSAASTSAVRPTSWIWNVGASSRSAWTAPSTSTRGALSPPIASSAIRITTGVLDRDPLLSLVIAARRAHPVRPLQVAALGTGLQRGSHRLVVGAPGALLPLRRPSLGYRHPSCPRSVAQPALQRHQRLPPRIGGGGRAAAGPRVQVLAAMPAQPAAIVPGLQVPRHREQQLLPHRPREIDRDRVRRDGRGIPVLFHLR